MADGLKKATLETLRTQSWRGTKGGLSGTIPWTLTGYELVLFYEAIVRGDMAPYQQLRCRGMSDRKADRAIQVLKRAGLIAFDATARVWRAT